MTPADRLNWWQKTRVKLLAGILLVALIPLVLFEVVTSGIVGRAALSATKQELGVAADHADGRLSEFISRTADSLRPSVYSPDLRGLPERDLQIYLANLLRRVETAVTVAFARLDGKVNAMSSRRQFIPPGRYSDLSNLAGLPSVRDGKTWYGPPAISAEGEPLMAVAVPAVIGHDHVYGMIYAEISLRRVFGAIGTTGGVAYVADAQGRIVGHPELSLVLEGTSIAESGIFRAVRGVPAGTTSEMLRYTNVLGRRVFGRAQYVKDPGWVVVVEMPVDEALAGVQGTKLMFAVVFGGSTLVAAVLALIIGSRVNRAFQRIRRAAAACGRGDFSHRIKPLSGGDLGMLENDLNTMSDQLARYLSDLELTTGEIALERRNLQALLDALPVGVEIADPQGNPIRMNDRMDRIWGRTTRPGKLDWSDYPEYCPKTGRWLGADDRIIVRAVRNGRQITEEEARIVRDDGSRGAILVSAAPVRDESAAITGGVAVVQDISDRRRMEDALKDSEARLRTVLDNVRVAIVVKDLAGRLLLINRHVESVFHVAAKDVGGKVLYDLLPKDIADELRAGEQKVIESGKAMDLEERIPVDGEMHHFITVRVPMFDSEGRLYATCSVATDITERKHWEEALEDARVHAEADRSRLRAILDSLPVGVFIADAQGAIIDVNDAARRFWGGEKPKAPLAACVEQYSAYRGWWADTGQPVQPRDWPLARAALEGKTVHDVEIDVQRFDGTRGAMLASAGPIRDSHGRIIGAVAIIHDITRRRQMERELVSARRQADAASAAKSQFLASMSHEIRTPMTAIIGVTELLRALEMGEQQRQYVEMVRRSARTLLDIINDILDFSRVERGKTELRHEAFTLSRLVDETLETLSVSAHQKGLELLHFTAPDVPDDLIGDPTRLRQVIVNLVGNAIKFTEHGEVVVRVAIDELEAAEPPRVKLHFTIADTGIGIPPDKLQAIFDPFAQLETPRMGGTGLGLSISRRLVQAMGGDIWAESQLGRGSTFHFTCRLQVQARMMEAAIAPPRLDGTRVLVVDDDRAARAILNDLFAEMGAQVHQAESSDDALAELEQAAREERPFLFAAIDADMPVIDGISLARLIGNNPALAGTRILILVPAGSLEFVAQTSALHGAFCLIKPVCRSRLREAVRSASAMAGEPSAQQPQEPVQLLAGLHVLLAEDDPTMQFLIQKILEEQGHSITIVDNGKAAVEQVAQQHFDVILMDNRMPEMGGVAATRAIRQQEKGTGRHVPIIALTAAAMKDQEDAFMDAGADSFVGKPFDIEKLYAEIESLGRGRRAKVPG